MLGVGKCFTFLWKLEHIDYCLQKKGELIKSPSFVVDPLEKTKWTLWIYPRGIKDENSISCFLNREKDSKGGEKIKIKYELAAIAKDSLILKTQGIAEDLFPKGKAFGFGTFLNREEVCFSQRSIFMPQDILTVRCRMWKSGREMPDVRCIAFTRIEVEKRSFLCKVLDFTSLKPDKKCRHEMKSIINDMPLMSIDVFLTGGLNSEEIRFELSLQDETVKLFALKLFLIDAAGNRVEGNQEEIRFDYQSQKKEFTFSFTKQKLLDEKTMYLPNDTLSLYWEWAFSKGIVSEVIKEVLHGCTYPEKKIDDAHNFKKEQKFFSNILIDKMKSLYSSQFLCDVKLKTNTGVFPAHKCILGTSSSVFKAMFSNDMKENVDNCVHIEDLSHDTVRRMLLYMYTVCVDDLTWESASQLFVAADKYAISSLKDICSTFLKDNLSLKNACQVLLFSDFYSDGVLKSAAQQFILEHGKQITKSEEWKKLMETNAKLAAETVCLAFK